MNFRVFTLFGLTLTLASTLIATDIHVAQAQRRPVTMCGQQPCSTPGPRGSQGKPTIPVDSKENPQSEKSLESGKAPIDQNFRTEGTQRLNDSSDVQRPNNPAQLQNQGFK
jgi:hypothetical protein